MIERPGKKAFRFLPKECKRSCSGQEAAGVDTSTLGFLRDQTKAWLGQGLTLHFPSPGTVRSKSDQKFAFWQKNK